MAKPTVEQRMSDFKRASEQLSGEALLDAIKAGVKDRSNLVVEMAARAVVQLQPGDCREELLSAWQRFVKNPLESDKNCRAKVPIVEALNTQGFDDPDFYLAGMKYIQMEPAYGAPNGYEDTAAHVRGACAFGLIEVPFASQNEMLFALVDLLHDNEAGAREAAARALGSTGLMAAAPLLRMKVLTGDHRGEVIGACFSGLLQYSDSRILEFVARFMESDNLDLAIEAGLALGESRRSEAVAILIDASNTQVPDLRASILISLGLSRSNAASDFLIKLIDNENPDAEVAIRALSPNRFDQALTDRVREAVDAAKNRELARVFREQFC